MICDNFFILLNITPIIDGMLNNFASKLNNFMGKRLVNISPLVRSIK